ncbi:MAG: hypothetical protein V1922_00440 [bacterium]
MNESKRIYRLNKRVKALEAFLLDGNQDTKKAPQERSEEDIKMIQMNEIWKEAYFQGMTQATTQLWNKIKKLTGNELGLIQSGDLTLIKIWPKDLRRAEE